MSAYQATCWPIETTYEPIERPLDLSRGHVDLSSDISTCRDDVSISRASCRQVNRCMRLILAPEQSHSVHVRERNAHEDEPSFGNDLCMKLTSGNAYGNSSALFISIQLTITLSFSFRAFNELPLLCYVERSILRVCRLVFNNKNKYQTSTSASRRTPQTSKFHCNISETSQLSAKIGAGRSF